MSEQLFLVPVNGVWIALSADQFAEAQGRARSIAPIATTGVQPPGEVLLTAGQMAERTGVPETWFAEQARREKIPHRMLGKYVRFVWSEVIDAPAFAARGSARLANDKKRRSTLLDIDRFKGTSPQMKQKPAFGTPQSTDRGRPDEV